MSTTTSTLHTPLCDLLGIEYPIILAGMGGAAGPTLAAAVSNAGGLGVVGATGYTPDELRGMTLHQAREMDPRDLLEGLGVPIGPARLKCALLSYKVLQGAVRGAEAAWPDGADLAG